LAACVSLNPAFSVFSSPFTGCRFFDTPFGQFGLSCRQMPPQQI
jgi:hypothetical protein